MKYEFTKSDKKKYILYKTRNFLFATIFKISFFAIFLFCAQYFFIKDPFHIFHYIVCCLIVAIIMFVFSRTFRVLFLKNNYVIDGKIFKKHIFHRNSGSSEYNEGPIPMVRAISDNGSISTPWLFIANKYFKTKDLKVKIITHKNKGIDFYIVE